MLTAASVGCTLPDASTPAASSVYTSDADGCVGSALSVVLSRCAVTRPLAVSPGSSVAAGPVSKRSGLGSGEGASAAGSSAHVTLPGSLRSVLKTAAQVVVVLQGVDVHQGVGLRRRGYGTCVWMSASAAPRAGLPAR